MTENEPSSTVSPQGRRVLVAVVTGEPGERVQAWREQHDPREAGRIPPHTTLCYWANDFDLVALGQQVRHAFPAAVPVALGGVHEFNGEQGTFYVQLLEAAGLDDARSRLYDGSHLDMGPAREWTWHITCVRDSSGRDLESLRATAAQLHPGEAWLVNRVACLELRGERYEPVATWDLPE